MVARDTQTVKRWVEREAGSDPLALTFQRSGQAGSERLALARASWGGADWLSGYNGVVVRQGESDRPTHYLEERVFEEQATERAAPSGRAGDGRPAEVEGGRADARARGAAGRRSASAPVELERAAFSRVRLVRARRSGESPAAPFEERRLVWMIDGRFAALFDLLRCEAAGTYTVGVRWVTPVGERETVRTTQGWTWHAREEDRPAGASAPSARVTLGFPHEGSFAAEGMERGGAGGQVLYQIVARRFRDGMRWSVGNLLLPHRGDFSRAERLPAFDLDGRKARPGALGMAVRIGRRTYACGASAGAGLVAFGRDLLATDADTFVWWRDDAERVSHLFFAGGRTVRVARASPPGRVRLLVPRAGEEGAGAGVEAAEVVRHSECEFDWTTERGLTVQWRVPVGHVEIHDDLEA